MAIRPTEIDGLNVSYTLSSPDTSFDVFSLNMKTGVITSAVLPASWIRTLQERVAFLFAAISYEERAAGSLNLLQRFVNVCPLDESALSTSAVVTEADVYALRISVEEGTSPAHVIVNLPHSIIGAVATSGSVQSSGGGATTLSGEVVGPTTATRIADSAITDEKVSPTADIAQSKIADLVADQTSQNNRLTGLEGRATALEADDSLVAGQISSLDGRVTGLEGRTTTLEGQQVTQDGRLAALEAHDTTGDGEISSLEGRVTSLEGRADGFDTHFATVDLHLSTIDAEQITQDGRLSSIEGRTTNIEAEQVVQNGAISSLEGRATSLEDRTTSLEGGLLAAQGDIDALQVAQSYLEGRVGVTETDIATLQVLVSDLDTNKADKTTKMIAGTGLDGGGDLSADRTFNVVYGEDSGTAAEGNDARLSDDRIPKGNAGGDLGGTYPDPSVLKVQGVPYSDVLPAEGQVYTFDGTQMTPSPLSIGAGGGGLIYFFNAAGVLGRNADAAETIYPPTPITLTTGGVYTDFATFTSAVDDPGITTIPAGIWDVNYWTISDANQANVITIQIRLYTTDGVTDTLVAASEPTPLYDPSVLLRVVSEIVIPGGITLLATDRLKIVFSATSTSVNKTVELHTGATNPSHVHTTINALLNLATGVEGVLPTDHGGTGLNAYNVGDVLYCSATNVLSKLPIGSLSQLFTVGASGIPEWAPPATNGTVTSVTAGDGLSGGTITGSGTIYLPTLITSFISLGDGASTLVLSADAKGRITDASATPIAIGQGQVANLISDLAAKVSTTDSRLSDSRTPSGVAGGSLAGFYPNPTLSQVLALPTTYGSASSVPVFAVNAEGRVTLVTNTPISIPGSQITGLNSVAVTAVAGTADQVLVDGQLLAKRGAITLSLPQSIGTTSAVQFGSLVLNTTPLAATSGGTGNKEFSTGDLLYASDAATLTRLARGTNGQYLSLSAGIPFWTSASIAGTQTGIFTQIPSATQTINAVGNTINPNAGIVKVNCVGNITLSSTPSIATAGVAEGTRLTVINIGTGTLKLQLHTGALQTKLQLANATVSLTQYKCIELIYINDGTTSYWCEITHTQ